MGKVTAIVKAAARFGPVVYPVVKKGAVMLRENPELASQVQRLLNGLSKARAARSRPEGLRRSVEVLRGQAQRALAGADTPAEAARAEGWLLQADKLDSAIDLMSLHDRKAQTADAAAIEARVEELFAQIFTALVRRDDPDAAQLPPA
ncbi:hypothetical protein FE251_06655 [Georgenia wutianyii]|uniref:Uncharacterized protein n=1 Tax=Georgenia wutianyii TaxID=2585135 RepID=A0ABX5VMR3_9MICO|nr:hypothetical protein [Georgenia wutianyii]QDB79086.1 hypothetical protein FE251_06655 [Georgenia wutianyii]